MDTPLRAAFRKYLQDGIFVCSLFVLYSYLPYYQQFLTPLAKTLILIIFLAWIVGAFPYYLWLYKRRPKWFRYEESRSLLALRWAQRLFTNTDSKRFRISDEERVAILSIIVKAFFFPMMLNYFSIHTVSILQSTENISLRQSLTGYSDRWYEFGILFLSLIDTAIFSLAYAIEHPTLGNKIKSVERSGIGWFVTLICYQPFNVVAGEFIWGSSPGLSRNVWIGTEAFWATRTIVFALFIIYVWASASLFWRAGNLVNRGIVSHGPYRFIRHPAYAAKNIAWWFEWLPYMTTPLQAIPLVVWNLVYILRAVTEERHLLRDQEYRSYVQRVHHRFIPKVI